MEDNSPTSPGSVGQEPPEEHVGERRRAARRGTRYKTAESKEKNRLAQQRFRDRQRAQHEQQEVQCRDLEEEADRIRADNARLEAAAMVKEKVLAVREAMVMALESPGQVCGPLPTFPGLAPQLQQERPQMPLQGTGAAMAAAAGVPQQLLPRALPPPAVQQPWQLPSQAPGVCLQAPQAGPPLQSYQLFDGGLSSWGAQQCVPQALSVQQQAQQHQQQQQALQLMLQQVALSGALLETLPQPGGGVQQQAWAQAGAGGASQPWPNAGMAQQTLTGGPAGGASWPGSSPGFLPGSSPPPPPQQQPPKQQQPLWLRAEGAASASVLVLAESQAAATEPPHTLASSVRAQGPPPNGDGSGAPLPASGPAAVGPGNSAGGEGQAGAADGCGGSSGGAGGSASVGASACEEGRKEAAADDAAGPSEDEPEEVQAIQLPAFVDPERRRLVEEMKSPEDFIEAWRVWQVDVAHRLREAEATGLQGKKEMQALKDSVDHMVILFWHAAELKPGFAEVCMVEGGCPADRAQEFYARVAAQIQLTPSERTRLLRQWNLWSKRLAQAEISRKRWSAVLRCAQHEAAVAASQAVASTAAGSDEEGELAGSGGGGMATAEGREGGGVQATSEASHALGTQGINMAAVARNSLNVTEAMARLAEAQHAKDLAVKDFLGKLNWVFSPVVKARINVLSMPYFPDFLSVARYILFPQASRLWGQPEQQDKQAMAADGAPAAARTTTAAAS